MSLAEGLETEPLDASRSSDPTVAIAFGGFALGAFFAFDAFFALETFFAFFPST